MFIIRMIANMYKFHKMFFSMLLEIELTFHCYESVDIFSYFIMNLSHCHFMKN